MKLTLVDDSDKVALYSADIIMDIVEKKPDSLLMLASGGSPTLTYQEVGKRIAKSGKKWQTTKIIKLDEWVGLSDSDSASCDFYLKKNVLEPWGISPKHYIAFDGKTSDSHTDCEKISQQLQEAGYADLCILGLGLNGHIGFNEPSSSLNAFASVIPLSETSKHHPMVSQHHDLTEGVTVGLVEIMSSKKIILIVTGEKKSEILHQLLSGKISTQLPGTMLLMHPNFEIIADKAACNQLNKAQLSQWS